MSILAGLAIFVAIRVIAFPPAQAITGEQISLTDKGQTSLAIVGFCLVLWTTEAVPFAVTGLAVFLLFSVFGIASAADIVGSGLGHPLMLFFLSLMLLATSFGEVGLSSRVSRWVMRLSRGQVDRLLFVTLTAGAVLSMLISALAATSVLVAMAQAILTRGGFNNTRSNFGRALLLATSWGPLIGSIGTPAGAGANTLMIGYLKELAGVDVSFAQWTALGLPVTLLLIPVAWVILRLLFPSPENRFLTAAQVAEAGVRDPLPFSRRERLFSIIMVTTVVAWMAGPMIHQISGGRVSLPFETVGLAAALILFLPGLKLLTWTAAERNVQWGALLVLAGGLTAGVMLYRTDAARWLAWILLHPLGSASTIGRLAIVMCGVVLLRLLFSSAAAAGAILFPLAIVLAKDFNANTWLFVAPVAFSVNLAFFFPTQAISHLLSYATGQFSVKDMVRGGVFLTAGALIVIFLVIRVAGG